jgi:hypothetical protein
MVQWIVGDQAIRVQSLLGGGLLRAPSPRLTAVIPFKASSTNSFARLIDSWSRIADDQIEVVICDGSDDENFAKNAILANGSITHLAVDRHRYRSLNDKVNGLRTGVRVARSEWVIVFDDDMYPKPGQLAAAIAEPPADQVLKLRTYVTPLTVLELIEVARALVSHCLKPLGDTSPVYFGRRSILLATLEQMPGNVLFDDREIEKQLRNMGPGVAVHPALLVSREPSVSSKWAQQQIRYAYEDLSLLAKTTLFLGLPIAVLGLFGSGLGFLAAVLIVTVIVALTAAAAIGWMRAGLRGCYPLWMVLWAPIWFAVRTVAVPIALWLLMTGGIRHGGRRIRCPSRPRFWGW